MTEPTISGSSCCLAVAAVENAGAAMDEAFCLSVGQAQPFPENVSSSRVAATLFCLVNARQRIERKRNNRYLPEVDRLEEARPALRIALGLFGLVTPAVAAG